MRQGFSSTTVIAASLIGSSAALFAATDVCFAAAHKAQPAIELKSAMQSLWEDHIAYTRSYIIGALADLQDGDSSARRLLRNQDGIGNAKKPYCAGPAGKRLAALLNDHIEIATEIVQAAKAGNTEQLSAVQKKWLANGREIAEFLSKANPNWPRKTLESMLEEHLVLTTREVIGRLKSDRNADIKSDDMRRIHMLMVSNMLADGIAKQFPEEFKE